MTVVRFIGDVHGKFKQYRKIIKDVPYSIQVGDMGVGFYHEDGTPRSNPPHSAMRKGRHYFIRGNHDNPEVCSYHSQYIDDNSTTDYLFMQNSPKVYFHGGGLSVDRHKRVEGINWWADEEVSTEKLYRAVDTYTAFAPDIVVTHDCPSSIADIIMGSDKAKQQRPSITRFAFESMLSFHRPKMWIFGHWHKNVMFTVEGTWFICLNELNYMDLDLKTGDIIRAPGPR